LTLWQCDIIGKKRKDASNKTELQGKSLQRGQALGDILHCPSGLPVGAITAHMNTHSIDWRAEEK